MQQAAVSNTFFGLVQTVSLDMRGAVPAGGRISIPEWMEFLKSDLDVDLRDIEEACVHSITGTLLVTFFVEEKYLEVLEKVERGAHWTKRDVTIFGWSAGEEVATVQLRNVLARTDLAATLAELGKYGPVLTHTVHYYKEAPAVRNGWVTVRMRLTGKSELPSYIYDNSIGNTVQVIYEKKVKVCYRCLGKGHIAAFCKKPRKTQATAAGSATWASVAAAPATPASTTAGVKLAPASVAVDKTVAPVGIESERPTVDRTVEPVDDPVGTTIDKTVEPMDELVQEELRNESDLWTKVEKDRKRNRSGTEPDPENVPVPTRPEKQKCPDPDLKEQLEEKKNRIKEKLSKTN